MLRRDFCKLIGSAAAASALPDAVQASDSSVATRSDSFTEDYARFCATLANERIFYALQDWMIGPFSQRNSANPILGPNFDLLYFCPIRTDYVAAAAPRIARASHRLADIADQDLRRISNPQLVAQPCASNTA